ncbi:nucleotide exchange factor GrpE [Actinopolymorpha alba]|uniref:nucleotide exchange factor GrpE n=1 Tax=Actinopolymorpha alba TaxID=533267 RepID=UPI00039BD544|nr:nucleotide exchange factor GrpE [Actinopolymorpha alba]
MTDQNAESAATRNADLESRYADLEARHADLERRYADLESRYAELESRNAELEDNWRRATADLDNLRKRLAREVEDQRLQERAAFAERWLPVLDNLDLALRHAEADPGSIVEGVRAVRDQAVSVLSALGYPRREEEEGARFDPSRHEAVATVTQQDDTPEGTVVHVVRPGYGDGERQLRPAAVVVAARKD